MQAFPKHLLTPVEKRLFEKLDTPAKIQSYLNSLPHNHSDTVQSIRRSIKAKNVHCFEGALLAAAILWFHGKTPLLLDLKTTKYDDDHVVTLFKSNGLWGTISSTHHAVLRYRDPIYKNLREVALSYFHEYFLNSGEKTLREYSKKPFSLLSYGHSWLFDDEELYEIGADLDDAPHEKIMPAKVIRNLRRADKIERDGANLTE